MTSSSRNMHDNKTAADKNENSVMALRDDGEQQQQETITCNQSTKKSSSSSCMNHLPLLQDYNLHGWTPDPLLSNDESYMELVMILTQSSKCRQGSMACILVKKNNKEEYPSVEDDDDDYKKNEHSHHSFYQDIIAVSINSSLFKQGDSDVHAEIGALGQAAQYGRPTNHATAYITMPPCKRCLGALVVSGISRIVTRLPLPPVLLQACQQHNIATKQVKVNMERIMSLVKKSRTSQDEDEIQKQRQQRKQERKGIVEKRLASNGVHGDDLPKSSQKKKRHVED